MSTINNAKGTAHKYGDHIDTDAIIAARYLNEHDAQVLASHCMEDIDAGFMSRMKRGDVIAAGLNFGCGSSREHAPFVLKTAGISCVIAKSFARIFYRNAINIGLPILECPDASDGISDGDTVSVDFTSGVITNETTGKKYQAEPFPPFLQRIIAAGGLMASIRAAESALSRADCCKA